MEDYRILIAGGLIFGGNICTTVGINIYSTYVAYNKIKEQLSSTWYGQFIKLPPLPPYVDPVHALLLIVFGYMLIYSGLYFIFKKK